MTTDDPHAALRDRALATVLEGPGETEPAVRQAAAANSPDVPADLQALVQKIHRHAYRVTDEDIAELQATYGDDRLFEVIVSAAMGASRARLMAGLKVLGEA